MKGEKQQLHFWQEGDKLHGVLLRLKVGGAEGITKKMNVGGGQISWAKDTRWRRRNPEGRKQRPQVRMLLNIYVIYHSDVMADLPLETRTPANSLFTRLLITIKFSHLTGNPHSPARSSHTATAPSQEKVVTRIKLCLHHFGFWLSNQRYLKFPTILF